VRPALPSGISGKRVNPQLKRADLKFPINYSVFFGSILPAFSVRSGLGPSYFGMEKSSARPSTLAGQPTCKDSQLKTNRPQSRCVRPGEAWSSIAGISTLQEAG
jgi:hypothetical protein